MMGQVAGLVKRRASASEILEAMVEEFNQVMEKIGGFRIPAGGFPCEG
jgi:hypothetical protein